MAAAGRAKACGEVSVQIGIKGPGYVPCFPGLAPCRWLFEIEAAIHKLPHKLKFPFIYCVLEEHSYDACAEILGRTRETVETRIYRARKRLQQELAELAGEF